jgi:hypothetical protein
MAPRGAYDPATPSWRTRLWARSATERVDEHVSRVVPVDNSGMAPPGGAFGRGAADAADRKNLHGAEFVAAPQGRGEGSYDPPGPLFRRAPTPRSPSSLSGHKMITHETVKQRQEQRRGPSHLGVGPRLAERTHCIGSVPSVSHRRRQPTERRR